MQRFNKLLFALLQGILIIFCITVVNGQNGHENAQFKIPQFLEECYREPNILERDNRLPMTIETLITLIRKIEDYPGSNMDLRQLATTLLHRFRQDGITRAPGVKTSDRVLPFSPSEYQFSKHRILLTRLIPGNVASYQNGTLTPIEKCTLHFMLSSSIERQIRGDEGQRCGQLARFRAMRLPREINKDNKRFQSSTFLGDVEVLESINHEINVKQSSPHGRLSSWDDGRHHPEENDRELPDEHDFRDIPPFSYEPDGVNLVDVASDAISQCPVENGVIWTQWGAVSGGNLIAGIAAGLQPQRVQLRHLLALARRPSTATGRQGDISVDNQYAATLAGDLAEVALIQAPLVPQDSPLTIGAPGGWNSTANPRWYFLTQRERLEITDAEIRGGLDGLIIASNIDKWKAGSSNLRLSQILEMYYSHKGVLNTGIRACSRKSYLTTAAPLDTLKAQTYSFASVLDREMQLSVTLSSDGIKTFANQAATSLYNYIPSMNDLSCETTLPIPNDPTLWYTATDIYIYIESSWEYRQISAIVGYIVQNINVSPAGSRVTLLSTDGKIIVNRTTAWTDVLSMWNATTHMQLPRFQQFSLKNVMQSIKSLTTGLMEEERRNNTLGGRSLIALIVPNNGASDDTDASFAVQQIQLLSEVVPDLRFLYLANGVVNRFERFVKDKTRDLYSTGVGDNFATRIKPVVKRIQEIPRRIINPRCGSNWQQEGTENKEMNFYLTPGSVNYYRIAPNYFFQEGGGRFLRIQAQSTLGLTICTSRSVELPRSGNRSQTATDGISCEPFTGSFQIDLSNPCSAYPVIHQCLPQYISVEAKSSNTSGTSSSSCSEPNCLTPDQVRFTVQTQNFGCFSGVERILSSMTVMTLCLIIIFKFNS